MGRWKYLVNHGKPCITDSRGIYELTEDMVRYLMFFDKYNCFMNDFNVLLSGEDFECTHDGCYRKLIGNVETADIKGRVAMLSPFIECSVLTFIEEEYSCVSLNSCFKKKLKLKAKNDFEFRLRIRNCGTVDISVSNKKVLLYTSVEDIMQCERSFSSGDAILRVDEHDKGIFSDAVQNAHAVKVGIETEKFDMTKIRYLEKTYQTRFLIVHADCFTNIGKMLLGESSINNICISTPDDTLSETIHNSMYSVSSELKDTALVRPVCNILLHDGRDITDGTYEYKGKQFALRKEYLGGRQHSMRGRYLVITSE